MIKCREDETYHSKHVIWQYGKPAARNRSFFFQWLRALRLRRSANISTMPKRPRPPWIQTSSGIFYHLYFIFLRAEQLPLSRTFGDYILINCIMWHLRFKIQNNGSMINFSYYDNIFASRTAKRITRTMLGWFATISKQCTATIKYRRIISNAF